MLTMTSLFVLLGLIVVVAGGCLMYDMIKRKFEEWAPQAKNRIEYFGAWAKGKECFSEANRKTASGSVPAEYTKEDEDLLEIVHHLAIAYEKTDKYLKS